MADSAAAIEAFGLLLPKEAWTIDRHGAGEVRIEVAIAKYRDASSVHEVIDRRVRGEVHGTPGHRADMPPEQMCR